ncbi:uncharacterized protein LOC135398493 [Ornithodoros turicata]|uniref:uncharacterized protein LOC135398493 n=1 Tax=Ornithodoros turicata TaxID=34597 RepID=UPI003138B565
MKETVASIELSIEMMSDKYDTLLNKIGEHDQAIKDLAAKVSQLESHQKTEEVSKLRQELNRLEQHSRLNNLELHGVVQRDNENLMERLREIADKINVKPPSVDTVEAIHRVPTKKGTIPHVIVRFTNRRDVEEWLKAKRRLLNIESNGEQIYVQENLTAANRKIFMDARMKARALGYKYVWHRSGVTYVRRKAMNRL